ncbi:MAG TPA: pantoate--beta-alanine ligase [Steroidobacteraceae bacterium]|jgi:pantoate--beta-alanine ligase|nr:pantoate--beta-alanine ligase [Steroidobacteraceae bacterium]
METVTTTAAVRERVNRWHREGERVAFVPTMGNLHAGHISLIELARQRGDRFVASIFVNPMQFGPNEDYAQYPRTPQKDEAMLAEAGCDLMFMPDVAEIYPRGFDHSTRVTVPELSGLLDGEFRPGHFDGVSTVVAKLFNIVMPDIAVFGEKDFQQLAIIRRMVADLCIPIEIIGAPTVREPDGLAMSSRNQYLTAAERRVAPQLYAALTRAVKRLAAGEREFAAIERAELDALTRAGFRPDYFTVRDAQTLQPPGTQSRHLVVLVAARLGKARLIDNLQFVG